MTSLDAPWNWEADHTYATGINNNIIVGYSWDIDAVPFRYELNTGVWTTLSQLGTDTFPQGISGGNMVGWYLDGGTYGFLHNGTNYTALNYPGTDGLVNWTEAYGICDSNIVGYYHEFGSDSGFIYNTDTQVWTSLNCPGTSSGTYVFGIDGRNLVGTSGDHGFLYNGSDWILLNYPGAFYTKAKGIYGDRIVGTYTDATGTHGFIYYFADADLNKDAVVDYFDFAIMANQWFSAPGTPSADIAPIERDLMVDFKDLAVISAEWLDATGRTILIPAKP